jgi:hypothetical protein
MHLPIRSNGEANLQGYLLLDKYQSCVGWYCNLSAAVIGWGGRA